MKKTNLVIGFVTPNNVFNIVNYSDINDYCKAIATNFSNIKDFNEFKKSYTVLDPYFDYVMMKKNYVFVGPLGKKKTVMFNRDGIYYEVGIEKTLNKYEDIVDTEVNDNNISAIKASNDISLGLDRVNIESLVDSADNIKEAYSAASTILNQIMIGDINVSNHYIHEDINPIDYVKTDIFCLKRLKEMGQINEVLLNSEMDKKVI